MCTTIRTDLMVHVADPNLLELRLGIVVVVFMA